MAPGCSAPCMFPAASAPRARAHLLQHQEHFAAEGEGRGTLPVCSKRWPCRRLLFLPPPCRAELQSVEAGLPVSAVIRDAGAAVADPVGNSQRGSWGGGGDYFGAEANEVSWGVMSAHRSPLSPFPPLGWALCWPPSCHLPAAGRGSPAEEAEGSSQQEGSRVASPFGAPGKGSSLALPPTCSPTGGNLNY